MATVLIGTAAFTVDMGGAYLAKRDTANATDAASLAGAKELAGYDGTCATIAANPTATSAARSSGDSYLADNVSSGTRNDFNVDGYGGPCPPPGNPHRYVVTVYALRIDALPLAQGRPAALFDREISGSALASAQLTVTYGR